MNFITDGFNNGKGMKKKLSTLFRRYFPQKATVCNSISNDIKIFFFKIHFT